MATTSVYESYMLALLSDKVVVTPQQSSTSLVVDRTSQEIRAQEHAPLSPAEEKFNIYGIIGIIQLLSGPSMVVITERRLVGRIQDHLIYEVSGTRLVPIPRTKRRLSAQQEQAEQRYTAMLEGILQTPSFYFSYTFDLTQSFQRVSEMGGPSIARGVHIHETADQRFFWNHAMTQPIEGIPELRRCILPIMMGFVDIVQAKSPANVMFSYALISRRSIHRAGTRFFRRGVDNRGDVANFIETEQIVYNSAGVSSFVQVRGSIPVFWTQTPNILYKPPFVLDSSANHYHGMNRHLASLSEWYGQIVCINLVNQTGKEKALADAFQSNLSMVEHSDQVRYVPFDFHKECANMRWDRLSSLMTKVEQDRKAQAFFFRHPSQYGTQATLRQTGVMRTSCVDCLDRTNVVQSMIAMATLTDQLKVLGAFEPQHSMADCPLLTARLRELWADHADKCSMQYAGSAALKSDFTRTGKRTTVGLLHDGQKAIQRYIVNNFFDGLRQDAYDLFLGHHRVSQDEGAGVPSPFERLEKKPPRVKFAPFGLLISGALLVITLLAPMGSTARLLSTVLCLGGAIVALQFIVRHGRQLVNQPSLNPSAIQGGSDMDGFPTIVVQDPGMT